MKPSAYRTSSEMEPIVAAAAKRDPTVGRGERAVKVDEKIERFQREIEKAQREEAKLKNWTAKSRGSRQSPPAKVAAAGSVDSLLSSAADSDYSSAATTMTANHSACEEAVLLPPPSQHPCLVHPTRPSPSARRKPRQTSSKRVTIASQHEVIKTSPIPSTASSSSPRPRTPSPAYEDQRDDEIRLPSVKALASKFAPKEDAGNKNFSQARTPAKGHGHAIARKLAQRNKANRHEVRELHM